MKRMYKKAILACGLAVSLAACTDVWEEHYQPDTALTGDKNLWELISDESDLSNFAALLSATRTAAKEGGIRYDSLLMMSRLQIATILSRVVASILHLLRKLTRLQEKTCHPMTLQMHSRQNLRESRQVQRSTRLQALFSMASH